MPATTVSGMPGGFEPRFYISTPDCPAGDEGIQLADARGLRDLMRKVLADILQDEGGRSGINVIEAEARDEEGRPVMRVAISFSAIKLPSRR